MDDASALVNSGRVALSTGDWSRARADFETAVERGGAAEALAGLAEALFASGDYSQAIGRGEEAFASFLAVEDTVRAAVWARFVGYLYWVVLGNGAAMNGWLTRAVHLIEASGDCPERARIELTRAIVTADPAARDRHLATADEIAQRHGDIDMIFDVSSQRGLHLVSAGRVPEGMALLDEALAAVASGEVRDLISVGSMYCKMLHACELTFDVRRAEDWLVLADGFVASTNRIPISAICRTHYGGILIAGGRWVDAERELGTAVELYDRSFRALRGAAEVRLALLRVRQGRLEDAAQLLVAAEHDPYAIGPRVELHLARGEADLAVARIERFLREVARSEPSAPVLLSLARARLALGDYSGAAEVSRRLEALTSTQPSPAVAAMSAFARGLVASATGAPDAVGHLEKALASFAGLGLPLEEARVRLELAAALGATRPELALVEARAALERFQELSATRDADAATSLLRRLGVRGHTGPRGQGTLTEREQEVLALVGHGLSNQHIAERLFLSRRTVEHHVSNILAKLGVGSRAEAAAYAARRAASR